MLVCVLQRITPCLESKEGGARGFPRGPAVKNPPCNAGGTDSISGRGTKIPHASGQLSPRGPQAEHHKADQDHSLQGKILWAAAKTRYSQYRNFFFLKKAGQSDSLEFCGKSEQTDSCLRNMGQNLCWGRWDVKTWMRRGCCWRVWSERLWGPEGGSANLCGRGLRAEDTWPSENSEPLEPTGEMDAFWKEPWGQVNKWDQNPGDQSCHETFLHWS